MDKEYFEFIIISSFTGFDKSSVIRESKIEKYEINVMPIKNKIK